MRKILSLLAMLISFIGFSQEQQVDISLDPYTLQVGDKFTIKVVIQNHPSDQISEFPEIPGFKREGRSVTHANILKNGKRVLQHTVIQNYTAKIAGSHILGETELSVNGKIYPIPESIIKVENSENPNNEEFKATSGKDNALLFLFVNKKEIYVGESFKIHLAFYVSEENTEQWDFPRNLSQRINQIADELKPKNCFESRKNITSIKGEPAQISGRNYIRYKVFEGIYYPLTNESIVLPSVNLTMDKTSEKDSAQVIKVPFRSKSFTVNVKPLPEHPLKDKVAVGHFSLKELTAISKIQTGKVLNYELELGGMGNTHTLTFEKPENDENFDFYPPSSLIKQNTGSEFGSRIFNFKIFPKDSGRFDLEDYFHWIYFDTEKGNYDTLSAKQHIQVTGSKIETYAANSSNFYDKIAERSIAQKETNFRSIIKNIANILLFLMLVCMFFIFDFQRKQ